MKQLQKKIAWCFAVAMLSAAPAAAQFGGGGGFGGGGFGGGSIGGGGAGGKVQTAAARKAEAQIMVMMSKECTIDFKEVPLTDVVSYLKKSYGANIVLDTVAMDEMGIGSDTPVTLEVEKISVRSALALLLKPLELTWMVRNEVLMITTYEEAEMNLATRMYPVNDLIKKAAGSSLVYRAGGSADYDELIEAITRTIEPESWEEVGGPGSVTGLTVASKNVLVVSQTDAVHQQIVNFFTALRDVPAATEKPARQPRKAPEKAGGEEGYGEAEEGASEGGFGGEEGFEEADGGAPGASETGAVLKIYPLDPNQIDRDADLAKLIEKSIEPSSWKAEDHNVDGVAGALIVRNSKAVQAQVVNLLQGMKVLREEQQMFYGGGSFSGVGNGGLGGGGGFGNGGGGNAGGFFGAAGK